MPSYGTDVARIKTSCFVSTSWRHRGLLDVVSWREKRSMGLVHMHPRKTLGFPNLRRSMAFSTRKALCACAGKAEPGLRDTTRWLTPIAFPTASIRPQSKSSIQHGRSIPHYCQRWRCACCSVEQLCPTWIPFTSVVGNGCGNVPVVVKT